MGFPSKNLFQWRQLCNATSWCLSMAAQCKFKTSFLFTKHSFWHFSLCGNVIDLIMLENLCMWNIRASSSLLKSPKLSAQDCWNWSHSHGSKYAWNTVAYMLATRILSCYLLRRVDLYSHVVFFCSFCVVKLSNR